MFFDLHFLVNKMHFDSVDRTEVCYNDFQLFNYHFEFISHKEHDMLIYSRKLDISENDRRVFSLRIVLITFGDEILRTLCTN